MTASDTTGVLGAARRQGRGTLPAVVLLAVAVLAAGGNIFAGLQASAAIAEDTAVATRAEMRPVRLERPGDRRTGLPAHGRGPAP